MSLPNRKMIILGHTAQELERLNKQAALVEPFTRRFLEGAGISSGMRVLDVGCGGGDVSLLARELVGADGEVVGRQIGSSGCTRDWSSVGE